MIDKRYTITTDATHVIEELLVRFESDRRVGQVELIDYLPLRDDPAYGAVATELARIDLELSYDQGQRICASHYIAAMPDVFDDKVNRSQLVFEEFRLRRRGGEDLDSKVFGKQYNVDGSRWPKLKLGTGEADKPFSTSRKFGKDELTPVFVKYPRVGDTFAGYPLIGRLGEGAYSRVFLARQLDLASRPVVLKVTPLSTDESDRLARLQHTNIIPVYSVHREGDLSCICMPFLGSITLADLSALGERWSALDGPAQELVSTILDRRRSTMGIAVEAERCLASESEPTKSVDRESVVETSQELVGLIQYARVGYVEALLALVAGAVEGLAHAHRRGLIHRDLKPANILVSDDGNAMLLDFNLAVSDSEPKTRIVGGTLPYMSPEQLLSLETGEAADARDDIFSIGIILYELLSGHLPFECPKAGEAFDLGSVIADRRKPPLPIHFLNHRVSPGLSAIIHKCLETDRKDRYRDATELQEDLNRHCQNLPLRYAPDTSFAERLTKWSTRHPRASSASSVAAIAAMMLLISGLLIVGKGRRIARLNAEAQFQQFQSDFPKAVTTLTTPGRETELLEEGVAESSRLLAVWIDGDDWRSDIGAYQLDAPRRQATKQHLAQLAYLMADAEADISRHLGQDSAAEKRRREQAFRWNELSTRLDQRILPLARQQSERMAADFEGRLVPPPTMMDSDLTQLDLQTIAAAERHDASLLLDLTRAQIKNQPSNVSLWFYSAIANARLSRWNEAVTELNVCDSMQSGSLATLFNRGLCHLQSGKASSASDDFSECLQIKPTMMAARFNRALAHQQTGDLDAALRDLDVLVNSKRATTRMVLMRGRVHEQLGNVAKAAADREYAMTVPPQDANDWVARGVSQLSQSPERALKDFLIARKLEPDHLEALQNAAHVYAERLNEPKLAIELLNELAIARPNLPSTIASRGIIHARLSNIDVAIADANLALTLDPAPREQLQIAGIYAISLASLSDSSKPTAVEARLFALRSLRNALRANPTLARTASQDTDLLSLRSDANFRRLVASAMTLESQGLEKSE